MAKRQKFSQLITWLNECSYYIYEFGETSDDEHDQVIVNSLELTFIKHYAGFVCWIHQDRTERWVVEIVDQDTIKRLRFVYSPEFRTWEDALDYAKKEVDLLNAAAERVRNREV